MASVVARASHLARSLAHVLMAFLSLRSGALESLESASQAALWMSFQLGEAHREQEQEVQEHV